MEIARLLLERGAQPNMPTKVDLCITLCLLVTCDFVVYVGDVCDLWVV